MIKEPPHIWALRRIVALLTLNGLPLDALLALAALVWFGERSAWTCASVWLAHMPEPPSELPPLPEQPTIALGTDRSALWDRELDG